jgi:hypothetical protein
MIMLAIVMAVPARLSLRRLQHVSPQTHRQR